MLHTSLLCGSLVVAALCGTLQETGSEEAPALEVLDHAALTGSLTRLANAHPALAKLESIGNSRANRSIDVLTLAAGQMEPGRPAVLVAANIEGPYAYTSSVVLSAARELAEGYDNDDAVRSLLESTTFYFIPRVNPDGAEARFESPLAERWATGHGVDNDRDGRSGEDGPSDVDGDGRITWMRVPDPEGEWIEDPTEPRALKKAERAKGERGLWKLVPEGRDTDGDEEVAEDPQQDAHVHRNFAQDWQEHAPSAGLFPTDEPEVRALCDFVIAHKDLQLVVVYGEQGNLVGKPKTVDDGAAARMRVPPSGLRKSDAALIEEIARRYKDATASDDGVEGSQEEHGTFQAWCYAHRGLFCLSIAPWEIPLKKEKEEKKPEDEAAEEEPGAEDEPEENVTVELEDVIVAEIVEAPAEEDTQDGAEDSEENGQGSEEKKDEKPTDDAKRIGWIDRMEEADRFQAWTAFEHPELGAVEIGGFAPYAKIEPPPETLGALAAAEGGFVRQLGDLLARVEIVEAKATSLGVGLVEIEAALENSALLPLTGVWGSRTRTSRPARVELMLEGAELLAGQAVQLVSDLPGSGGRRELRWLVRGKPASIIRIRVETDNAGSVDVTPEVQ